MLAMRIISEGKMRKISEMYKLSGGTDYRHTCYECNNCKKQKSRYTCSLYVEHGGDAPWMPSYIACKFYNLPHLPEKLQNNNTDPQEYFEQMSLNDFLSK